MKPVYEQQRGNSGSSAKRQTAEITESKQGVCQDYQTSASSGRFDVVVRFKSSCVAGCTEHRLHQTNSVSFWQDTATTTTTCRVSSSQISTTLQCTKLNGWSDRLDPVHVWTAQPHRRQGRLHAHGIYFKTCCFHYRWCPSGIHRRRRKRRCLRFLQFSSVPLCSSSCWRLQWWVIIPEPRLVFMFPGEKRF